MDVSSTALALISVLSALGGVFLGKLLDRWDRRDIYIREDAVAKVRFNEWIDQRWWERKADMYTGILSALGHLVENYREWSEWHSLGDDGPIPDWVAKQRDHSNWVNFHYDLENRVSSGTYLITEATVEAIRYYLRKADLSLLSMDDQAFAESAHAASLKTLEIVRREALQDLAINRDHA